MSDITVRPLGADDWEQLPHRAARGARRSPPTPSSPRTTRRPPNPRSSGARGWNARPGCSPSATAEPVGIASVGAADDDQPEAAQLFGLWVSPEARGTGVATELVRAGAPAAATAGKRQLLYWVGTDNGRAVAFASGFGFRPTAQRRPMRVVSEDDGEEELAMTLPLAGDRGGIASW